MLESIDTSVKLVTVDTNLKDDKWIVEIGRSFPYIQLYTSQITTDELGGEKVILGYTHDWGMFGETMLGDFRQTENTPIPAVFTIGTSQIGGNDVVPADRTSSEMLSKILKIATTGSFQYPRDASTGNRKQLNDARILQAHCAAGHHILVSNDGRFFGKSADSEKRKELEQLCNTRIRSADEFVEEYRSHFPDPTYLDGVSRKDPWPPQDA